MMRICFFAAAALGLVLGPAQAADIAQPLPLAHTVTAGNPCAAGGVLGSIKHRFAYGARNTGLGNLSMTSIGDPQPSGHPYAEPGFVKRDYCMATALLSDGSTRPVYFTIEHGLGFAGVGRSVDFCVLGLDVWHVHDGDCRTVR